MKPIQLPTWVANIVAFSKNNEQIFCCIDFRDLNKACLKDEFLFLNIDMLVDATVDHQCSPWMVSLAVIISIWIL